MQQGRCPQVRLIGSSGGRRDGRGDGRGKGLREGRGQGRPGRDAGRLAQHEPGGHQLAGPGLAREHPVHVGEPAPSQLAQRQLDGGQAGGRDGGHRDVVEARHRDVPRDLDAELRQARQGAQASRSLAHETA